MIGTVLSWLSGGVIGQIGKELRLAHGQKLAAQNDADRIAAETRIAKLQTAKDEFLAQAASRQAVLVAEQAHWSTRWIRPAFAAIVWLFYAKVIIWDLLLGWGATDMPSEPILWMMTTVLAAYFIGRPFEKVFGK